MEEKGRTQAKRPLLSAVVPCYNEEEALPLCYQALCEVAEQMPQVQFEFWLIDDGSSDRTSDVMRALRGQDARVHYVLFSRNFGKEAALYAGLELRVRAGCRFAGPAVAVAADVRGHRPGGI